MLTRFLGNLRKRINPPRLGLLGPDSKAPQEINRRDWDFDKLAIATSYLETVDLSRQIKTIFNQQKTLSCVAQAWEQALRLERIRLGYPPILGSRLFGYSNARATHGEETTDGGTYLRSYAWSLKKIGNCQEGTWPFEVKNVNKYPPAKAFREAWGLRGIKGYYKIHDNGSARTMAVRAALALGKPVVFGTYVDLQFGELRGESTITKPQAPIGGHAMCICGYTPDLVFGDYKYKIVNSWGEDWRFGGYTYLTEEYLQWENTQDLWVVSLT